MDLPIGTQVLIGSKYAKVMSYQEIIGKIGRYDGRSSYKSANRVVYVKGHSGPWFVHMDDVQLLDTTTNDMAVVLLRKD